MLSFPDSTCRAVIRAEQEGIIAGIAEASALFTHFGIVAEPGKQDGDTVIPHDIILSLAGNAKGILLVERTALNIIGRMSGIATQTRKLADMVSAVNSRCRIAATRKTCPGLRALDKKAVQLGGGDPHRMSLSDGILIKDNHLVLVPLTEAIRSAKAVSAYRKIEVEVETPHDALTAAKEGADIILLDNMTPRRVRETLAGLKRAGLRDRVTIELSGGIDETTLPGLCNTRCRCHQHGCTHSYGKKFFRYSGNTARSPDNRSHDSTWCDPLVCLPNFSECLFFRVFSSS